MSAEAKAKTDESIQVVVRCRPLNKKENDEKRNSIIDIDVEARQVSIKNPDNLSEPPKYFTYDAAYDDKTQQRIFYDESCFSVIEGTLEGFNSTIFAYGQTGCGKSFTMQGPSTTVDELKGVIPNSFSHIFQFVKASKDMEIFIRCSYLELYNEEIKDLLSSSKQGGAKCELKEDPQKGVYVKGLTSVIAQTAEDLNAMLDRGLIARTTASTNMNAESSRSHSIFTIIVEMNTKDSATGKDMLRVGKLNLVDLAGSERQKKTGATDAVLKEGIKINLSLSALGNVISALSEGSRHIPYRDSKLTRLLQDSLGGNTKTMMIAAISPADYNYEETMSTLRYANRAKNIKNKPKINEDPKDTMIREFKEEIERLRKLLSEHTSAGGGALPAGMMSALLGEGGGAAAASTAAPSSTTATADSIDRPSQQAPAPQQQQAQRQSAEFASPVKRIQEAEDEDNCYSPDKDHGQAADFSEELDQERRMRLEVESRLHQLEGMLAHDNAVSQSAKAATITAQAALSADGGTVPTSELMTQPWAPTAEEIEEEAEAARNYQLRREEARKKKEAQQARELQRMLEERRVMEEELEALRGSRSSSRGYAEEMADKGANNNSSAGSTVAAAVAEVQSAMAKKMGRMKKKFEKKLAAAKEALEDLQEDFSFQRRQFMEAAAEQEKDTRLYELICQSVLSEKDLKRIIEKCRYDEDADEWIVPFGKKRAVADSVLQGGDNYSSGVHSAHSSNGKLLPDINNAGQGGGSKGGASAFQSQALSTLRDPSKLLNRGGGSARDSGARDSPVPLLTLPGNLVTPASLASPVGQYASGTAGYKGSFDSKGGMHLPQISSRSDANSARQGAGAEYGGYDQQLVPSSGGLNSAFSQVQMLPTEKKKKAKSKIPKAPSGGSMSSAGGGVGFALSSARSQGEGDYIDYTDNDSGSSIYYHPHTGSKGEEGADESAGPLEDWGFVVEKSGPAGRNGLLGSEKEYSEDEDFESAEDIISGSQYKTGADGPYPPAYGKPRKGGKNKKKRAEEELGGAGSKASCALPPI